MIMVGHAGEHQLWKRQVIMLLSLEKSPEALSLTSISTTSAMVSWAPLAGVRVLRGCSLRYYSVGSPSTVQMVNFTLTSSEAVITGFPVIPEVTTFSARHSFPLSWDFLP
eukprot:g41549.t1